MKDKTAQETRTPSPRATLLRAGAACALALAAGCGKPAGPDVAQPDMGGSQTEARPIVLPLSANGHDRFFGVTYGRGGELYAAGSVTEGTAATADFKMVVAKLTATGALDKAFGQGGLAVKNVAVGADGELARAVVVQSTGKIVVAGTIENAGGDARDRDIALLRFNADGSEDKSFGQDGVALLNLSDGELVGETYVTDTVWGLTVYGDDRLLLHGAQKRMGGTDTDFAVVRLTAEGARDNSFGTRGVFTLDLSNRSASPRGVNILPDGSIVANGYYNDGGPVKPVLFKLTSAGQLDPSFGQNGVFNQGVLMAVTEVYAVALQGTSLVTTGYGRNDATESLDMLSMRITAAGALDTSYGTGGYARIDIGGFNDNSRHLVLLPDQRPMLVGGGRLSENNLDAAVALLTRDGQRDTSFGQNGFKTYDLGGTADTMGHSALSPDKGTVAVVGVKSSGATGNDDAALLLLPVAR